MLSSGLDNDEEEAAVPISSLFIIYSGSILPTIEYPQQQNERCSFLFLYVAVSYYESLVMLPTADYHYTTTVWGCCRSTASIMTSSVSILQRRTLLISLIFILQLIIFVRNFIQNQCKLFNGDDNQSSSSNFIIDAPSTSNSLHHNTHLDKLILSLSTTVPKYGISNILTATQTSPSFHIFVYPTNVDKYISKRILQSGIYEGGTTRLVESILPIKSISNNGIENTNDHNVDVDGKEESCNIDLVLDLGSNLGYYSLLAASRGYDVISFEASPDTAWLQRSSAALNGWLVDSSYYHSMQDDENRGRQNINQNNNKREGSLLLFPVGVSDISSTGRMSRHSSSPGMTSFATSNTTKDQFHLQPGINGSALDVDIELVRADDVLSELGLGMNNNTNTNNINNKSKIRYRLLKIDVEGYEMKALQGLHLNNYPFESIVMEYFPAMLTSAGLDQPMELLEYISSFGYDFYIIEAKSGSVKKISLDDSLFSKGWVVNDHVNILAKKKNWKMIRD